MRLSRRVTASLACLAIVAVLALPFSLARAQAQSISAKAVSIDGLSIVSLSPDGHWLAAVERAKRLCVVDAQTLAQRACADLSAKKIRLRTADLAWSPDGARLAIGEDALRLARDGDIWIMDAATGALADLTDDGTTARPGQGTAADPAGAIQVDVVPSWSPDGATIAFARSTWVNGAWSGTILAAVDASGGPARTLATISTTEPGAIQTKPLWTADSTRLIYSVAGRASDPGDNGVWQIDLAGGPPRQIVGVDPDVGAPAAAAISPGGERLLLLYASTSKTQFTPMPWRYALLETATGARTPLGNPEPSDDAVWLPLVAALSPDGATALAIAETGSGALIAYLWDAASGSITMTDTTSLTDLRPSTDQITTPWAANHAVLLHDKDGAGELVTIAP